jgi:dimethylargininase
MDRAPIDYERARVQHAAYCEALRAAGAEVRTLPASPDEPDSCFVEDTAVVLDKLAVITSMGSPVRRSEIEAIAPELARYRPLARISLPATIDGGDVLPVGRRLFVGLSRRTSREGFEALAALARPYGYEVIPVQVNAGSLHLRTACTSIDDETLLLNPAWLDPTPLQGFRLLEVHEDEPWAANVLRVNETHCVSSSFPRTLERIERVHSNIVQLDISEFQKAEAGLTCLSLLFQVTGEPV